VPQSSLQQIFRLDYLSCILTVTSTLMIGRRRWQGWIFASVNSIIICVISFRTTQLGFIPANLFCLGIYVYNMLDWQKAPTPGIRILN
jgi:hypothetical protein